MNHTPGPWHYDLRAGMVAVYAGEKLNCLDIPHDGFLFSRDFEHKPKEGGWTVDEQACADAKLIAAAPDLLQALILAEKYITRDMAHRVEFGWPQNEESKDILNKARAVIRQARTESPAAWLQSLVVGCRIRMGQTRATITQAPEPGFFYYKTDLGNKGYFDMSDWKLPEGDPSSPVEILDEGLDEKR